MEKIAKEILITKIVTFVIIAIIAVPFITYDTGIRCIQEPCMSSTTGSFLMFVLFSYENTIYENGISYLNLIIGLIISYCISNFLVNKSMNFLKEK